MRDGLRKSGCCQARNSQRCDRDDELFIYLRRHPRYCRACGFYRAAAQGNGQLSRADGDKGKRGNRMRNPFRKKKKQLDAQVCDCGQTYIPKWDTDSRCQLCHNRALYLPWDAYLSALKRLPAIIQSAELYYYDDTTIGDKSTECTWGLCSESEELWAIDDRLHYSHKYRQTGQTCPMERTEDRAWEQPASGCFYRCRFFSPNGQPRPTQQDALQLINARIKLVETWLENNVVKDLPGIS